MTKLQNLLHTFFKPQAVKTSLFAILFVMASPVLFAQTVNTVSTGVWYLDGVSAATDNTDYALYCNATGPDLGGTDRSFVYTPYPESNQNKNDPWVSSALIEYDQPYPSPTANNNYPNHCLGLCASFSCSNLPVGQSTYSVAFPLQRITFDIFKYYNGKNPKNPDELPSIRSIDVYPAQDLTNYKNYTCGSYHCTNAGKDDTKNSVVAECLGAHWACDGTNCWPITMTKADATKAGKLKNYVKGTAGSNNQCTYYSSPTNYVNCCEAAGHSDCVFFDNNGAETNEALSFCTGWDGFYEMGGEFGKSNGDFGFRATAYTNVPSDGVIADRIEIQEMGVYPGYNGATQIPIQIDVTNVHMVRSTPTLVGTITPVSAQPYTFTYRLSKDADVRIAIFDASTEDITAYAGTAATASGQQTGSSTTVTQEVFTPVTFATVCSRLGGSAQGNDCVFHSGNYATETGCNYISGTWTAAAEVELQILTEEGCSAIGGTLVGGNNSATGTLTPLHCAWSTTGASECESMGGTWYVAGSTGGNIDPAGDSSDMGDYCYFTAFNENICTGSSMTWRDGACYSTSGVSCQVAGNNQTICQAANYTWQDGQCGQVTTQQVVQPGTTTDVTVGASETNTISFAAKTEAATAKIVRTLADWQPRTGEGIKGVEKDTQISDFDSWDGRNDDGLLLPAGNYLASIQAKTQDEWPGIDFSRAVTRQVSLDPLKLTDVRVTGLSKQSTAYATISYVPTEPSTVYWEVYTPGTRFVTQEITSAEGNSTSAVLTNSSAPTGTAPTLDGNMGSLVYRSAEQKTGRMNYTQRWDGTCQALDADGNPTNCVRTYAKNEKMSNGSICTNGNCKETFAYGAPMPDGNYVYVLWAEVPYNGCYSNAAATKTDGYYGAPKFEPNTPCTYSAANNNKQFTGVKTLKYTVGTLELERGLVGITMQPASYATLGSSPTAYGLDPFIFKYSLDRNAQVIATVENTAGVVVKYLTLQEGEPNVAQQLNTLTWDGRDEQGRMVYPGTYMFRVKAMDAMFPAMSNTAITVFPVDMYRVVDVATTDVYGDSNAKATISYHLSKTMNAQVNIYNKDVVIPHYNNTTGDYNSAKVTAVYSGSNPSVSDTTTQGDVTYITAGTATITINGTTVTNDGVQIPVDGSVVTYGDCGANTCRNTWTAATNRTIVGDRDKNQDLTNNGDATSNEPADGTYTVYLKQEVLDIPASSLAAWPPRICNLADDAAIFTDGHVDPAKVNQTKTACIYVNDTTFTNYPANAAQAAANVLDVRLQPIHTFDRSSLRVGDDGIVMEEWDALYFYNPTPDAGRHTAAEIQKCQGQNEKANCPYEMVPDGQYPFFISARSNEPFNRYYYDALRDNGKTFGSGHTYTISGEPFRKGVESDNVDNIDVQQEDYLYASDKVVHKINVTRGPVYFLEGSTAVFPNAPQLFNASSTTLTFIPPYEINFSISRAAQVEVAIVALEANMCSPVTDNVKSGTVNVYESRTNVAGEICKFLSTMTIANTGHFDANVIRKIYWDGTDHTGNYVKPGIYEVRLTARNYPDAGLYQPTVKSITLNADLLKVFDLLETDNYAISQRNTNMKIGYQVSVPMKVAIQIFKPGTTIYDYAKGTLRNPTTGKEVQDIREVLVRSIVGLRPGTTLIEEVWDGRDYAQQEVPDGIYPFRFVTSLDSAAVDSVTGEILFGDDASTNPNEWKIQRVADTYEYQNLHKATIAIGDGRFVCEDWQKTVFFYPNPLNDASKGTLEITKMPVPGTVSIKYFNLAGDLVRDSDYTCVDANNYQTTMGSNLYFQPDNNVSTNRLTPEQLDPKTGSFYNVRNAALRCKWDRTNQHGKKVARGVYFGLVDFKAYNGREHCQKVVKILIP